MHNHVNDAVVLGIIQIHIDKIYLRPFKWLTETRSIELIDFDYIYFRPVLLRI